MLRPDLERIEGFVDNIRWRSLTHEDGSSRCPGGGPTPPGMGQRHRSRDIALWLGLGLDAVLSPGNVLLLSWRDQGAAEAFEVIASLRDDLRLRRVRAVRDYSMFDRRESPQYYPDVETSRGLRR